MPEYQIMNRNHIAATVTFNSRWHISDCKEGESGYLPFWLYVKGSPVADSVDRWFHSRLISPSRAEYKRLMESLCMEYLMEAAVKGNAKSLLDQYWIKEKGDPRTWEEVNCYKVGFDSSVSAVLAKADTPGFIDRFGDPSLMVPGNRNYMFQTVSVMRKNPNFSEKIEEGKNNQKFISVNENCMFCFEDREYLATEHFLMNQCMSIFGLSSAKVELLEAEKDVYYSKMPLFTSSTCSFVTASQLIMGKNIMYEQVQVPYKLLCLRIKEFGTQKYNIGSILEQMERMFLFDALFHCTDRSFSSFGFLIDEKNKTFTLAPLYWSGRGLFHSAEIQRNPHSIYPVFFEPSVWNLRHSANIEKILGKIDFKSMHTLPDRLFNALSPIDSEKAEMKANRIKERIEIFPELVACLIHKKAEKFSSVYEGKK